MILRAPSLVRIRENEEVAITHFPSTSGPVRCAFRTYFGEEGFSVRVPRGIYAEVQSTASTVDEAIAASMNAAMTLKAYVGVCANAAVGDFEVELAFDATPSRREHEYMQQFLRAPSGYPQPGRWTDAAATKAVVEAVASHARLDRLHRAIVHYDLALRYWRTEFSVLSLSHLWIAVEALTRVARDRLKTDLAVADEDALASLWGIEKKKLDPEIRKRSIFHGDTATYSAAVKASDAYEHSFEDFWTIWKAATPVREQVAAHVRMAILELAAVPTAARHVLLSAPFDRPYETVPLTRRVHGELEGDVTQLAAADRAYPFLKWSSTISNVSRDASGLYAVGAAESFTPMLGPGTKYKPQRIEWWGPRQDAPASSQPQQIPLNVTFTRAPNADHGALGLRALALRAWRWCIRVLKRG